MVSYIAATRIKVVRGIAFPHYVGVVGIVGLEPTIGESKSPALTIWLYPIVVGPFF